MDRRRRCRHRRRRRGPLLILISNNNKTSEYDGHDDDNDAEVNFHSFILFLPVSDSGCDTLETTYNFLFIHSFDCLGASAKPLQ